MIPPPKVISQVGLVRADFLLSLAGCLFALATKKIEDNKLANIDTKSLYVPRLSFLICLYTALCTPYIVDCVVNIRPVLSL